MSVRVRTPARAHETPKSVAPKTSNALRALSQRLVRKGFAEGLTAPDLQILVLESYLGLALTRARLGNGRLNRSRVELLTGINRKHLAQDTQPADVWTDTATTPWVRRIMNAWRTDPKYLDARGRPRSLAVQGAMPSFETLCDAYAEFIPKRAMLDALKDLNLIAHKRISLLRLARCK